MSTSPHAVIVHGYGGHPEKNWFPWLKKELEQRGWQVSVPTMPHTEAPQLNEWLRELTKVIGPPTASTYLIGHSLGCITILRYLESLPTTTQIGGAVLVAGFSQPIHFEELNNFFSSPLDYAKCRASAAFITAINSDNDPHVPLSQAEVLQERLGAKLLVYPSDRHLNEKAGFTQLPLVLDELLQHVQK